MSIALDTNNNNNNNNNTNRFESSKFLSFMIFDSPEKTREMDGKVPGDVMFPAKNDELDSCSTSSVGRNSDCDSESEDDGEVQSSYKGPLDTLDALQESLPVKRGISKFYSGKSKSYTSLADASSASVREIAKPENAYTRKRKNIIATSIMIGENKNNPLRNSTGGISKRLTSLRRPPFMLGTPTSSSESLTSENSNTSSSSPPRLPPLHPQPKPSLNQTWMSQQSFSSRRAFSLTDLQRAEDNHSSSISNRDENKKHH